MAVEYQNKSEVSLGTPGLSITIPIPTGFSVGDLLIACVVRDAIYEIVLPAGWTLIQKGTPGAGCYESVSYRIAEEGDTEWTWTGATDRQAYGIILRYTGQASSDFIHASGIATGATTTPTAPDVSYTDLEAGSLCLQVFGADDDDTPYITPVQLTERYNGVSGTSGYTCGGAGGDKVVSGTGTTGTAVFTQNAAEQWVAVTVIIESIISRTLEGAISFTGTLSTKKSYRRLLEGTLNFIGTLSRKVSRKRIQEGAISFIGTLQRKLSLHRLLEGSISFIGILLGSRLYKKTLEGSISFIGTLSRKITFKRILEGKISFMGTLKTTKLWRAVSKMSNIWTPEDKRSNVWTPQDKRDNDWTEE